MTPRTIEVRRVAEDDLAQHYEWLLAEAGVDIAETMLTNATAAFDRLAEIPGLGAPVDTIEPELIGTRKWRI